METNDQIKEKIGKEIEKVCYLLNPDLIEWLTNHRIEPRRINVTTNIDDKTFKEVWLVTDNISKNDSSYRIIFDPEVNSFGLVCTLNSGINWYMGIHESLLEAIENI